MMKYLTSSNVFEEESPIKLERIVVPESLRNENDFKHLLAHQDTLDEEELDQSSLQTFEKMYMQDDLQTLNESYN